MSDLLYTTSRRTSTDTSSTEKEIATVHAASAEDVDKAVQAAHKAFKSSSVWNSPTDRGIMMNKLADLIEANKVTFATIDAWDNGTSALDSPPIPSTRLLVLGKSYTEALGTDLIEAVSTIRYYAGWADKVSGQTIVSPAKLAYTLRQPVGVIGQIIPWNYPLSMATWRLGPALACGNTVVLKAAERTPLSVLLLGKLVIEAGFPGGVVNIINGYGEDAGAALVQHPLVDKIAFTG